MKYLRRMALVFTCVMLMGGLTACGNGDNAAVPDYNTGGANQNGTVNDATDGNDTLNGNDAAGTNGAGNDGAAGNIVDDIGDGVDDAVDDVENGVDDMTRDGANNQNVNDNHTIDGQE